MADFKISRIRYTWRGDWNVTTQYNRDDVIKYGGSSWVCIRQHIASTFINDQDFLSNPDDTEFSPAWKKMTDGRAFVGEWIPEETYAEGDIISYGGNLYVVIDAYVSGLIFEDGLSNLSLYTSQIKFREGWNTSTRYGANDLVKYGGIVYRCIQGHTSAETVSDGLEQDQEKWQILNDDVEYRGDWQTGTRYRVNDLVKFGGSIFRCKKEHTPGSDSTLNFDQDEFWEIEFPGFQYKNEWNSTTVYQLGSLVRHGGYLFLSITNNYNSVPTSSIYQVQDRANPPDWEILAKGIEFRGNWSATTNYKIGDVVRRGGNLYVALLDTELTADGSSLDYLDESNWELLTDSLNWRNFWTSNTGYQLNDVVTYLGSAYKCNTAHVSSVENFPGDNGSGFFFWDILLEAGSEVGLLQKGDLLTYNLSRALVGDGSTFGSTNVPIGNANQLLTVNDDNTVVYENYANLNRGFYVGISGVDSLDDPQQGKTFFKPFRTVRFAAEQADDGFLGTTTINISGGRYEEILPIIVPKKTAIVGSELRTTEIVASPPGYDLSVEPAFIQQVLNRISQLIQPIIIGSTLNPAKSLSNILDPIVLTEITTIPGVDEQGNPILIEVTQVLTTDSQAAQSIQELILNINSYIDFYISSAGFDPAGVGTNTATNNQGYANAILVLEANKEFLVQESISFLRDNYPTLVFNEGILRRDVIKFIDAWKHDIIYTGNYKSLLAARFYRNSVLGSKSEDMFYCRDASGVRFCTVFGLEGSLNPPDESDLYRLPTGGSFVSLDPGWGPEDERTWIMTRSPYIQNVTTIGRGCTGQKIDGALHSGGNKSIVSNDFTQVISDGIGAWVTNNGRAELVSVFSYYAHIGYLAQNGGIIRGTNGNCSYGVYGAVSDRVDLLEIPLIGNLNNRNQQAIVASAFSGDFTDEILIIEWANAGQNYTQATGTVLGSGANASVLFEDFRDDAVFESRLLDAADQVRASFIGSISGGILTVTSFFTGRLLIGYSIEGAGVNPLTQIVSFISGSGTVGTYQLNVEQEVTSTTMAAFTVGSLTQEIGGSGFTVQQNNAQTGTTTSITIAASDTNVEANYLGMRIIVTSGPGTGQYGYVDSYNNISKVLQVKRESDGESGWDHVVSGRPPINELTTQSTYRIEPRPIFEEPQFSAQEIITPTSANWQNIVYGETTESFNNVQGTLGSGVFIPDDGLEALAARFNVVKLGRNYTVTLANGGVGYAVNDVITVSGILVGGINGVNDIVIKVMTISNDSTNSIIDFTSSGTAASGKFVAIARGGSDGLYSSDGEIWEQFNMPTSGNWSSIAAGNNRFIAIRENSSVAASSLNGRTWTTRSMPASRLWISAIYAQGIFFAIAKNLNSAATSTDGITWVSESLPIGGDSTFNEWIDVAYGNQRFVVLANSNNLVATGTYNNQTSTFSWNTYVMDVMSDSSQKDWVSIAYGNNRFVAISSQGDVAYSFDGLTWLSASMPNQDGSTAHNWKKIRYAQGVFFAIGDTEGLVVGNDPTLGPTTFAATSFDGVVWNTKELASEQSWSSIAFGNPYIDNKDSTIGKSTPMWVAISSNSDVFNKIRAGARALGRVTVNSGLISSIKIWDPGSAYTEKPRLTIIDPNKTSDPIFSNRIADGVLTNPTWINRGIGYRTSSTRITINGDGFADIIPVGKFITLSNLDFEPGPGAQLQFTGNESRYGIVTVESLTGSINNSNGFSVRVRITPELRVRDFIEHDTEVTIRSQYSQIRLTGHDFLDIGTGNFEQTNYPDLYNTGLFTPAPENEVIEEDGGRVFYTSTDQSGNFRTGELFAVEQATGIVTISSDFFDFSGLTELKLGGIRLGGSGVVIREFSTDSLFTADSNNIVPTQRSIRAFLQNRLSIGGSELAVGSFIAGTILVGPNRIGNVAGLTIQVPVRADFIGPQAGISGTLLAQTMFFRSWVR
jgi:hypothetical protein